MQRNVNTLLRFSTQCHVMKITIHKYTVYGREHSGHFSCHINKVLLNSLAPQTPFHTRLFERELWEQVVAAGGGAYIGLEAD